MKQQPDKFNLKDILKNPYAYTVIMKNKEKMKN